MKKQIPENFNGLIPMILVLLGLILLPCGCEKDIEQLPLPDENGYIWLRDVKSLSLIKQTIRGNWKMHYAYGGFTGHGKIDLKDSWERYLPNDSLYIIFEGDTYAATKPDFIRKQTEFGFDAWILNFEFINAWQLREELVIEFMRYDTLELGHNNPDPYGYYMTKTP
ncbi:MAG TPA: hypothetical protein DCY35_02720 [Prolixibacteraceae bacterium]|nr:hypothetical protein [Prolixibacteraceae bacterium]